jgi:hypothetical protein
MATTSKAQIVMPDKNICQGDVFHDVRYAYIDSEDNDGVEVVEFKFPMAIIVSQACDVNSMGEMILERSGRATKLMPSILMCPVYNTELAKKTNHLDDVFTELKINKMDAPKDVLFNSSEFNLAKNDWHYRYHALTVKIEDDIVLENAMIDFKHYFTVPASYLMRIRENRLFHLDDLFAEQVTLKFSTYLSRVAIP